MSLSWRDRIEIFLGPSRVELTRHTSGLRARVALSHAVECGEANGAVWQPAIDALGRALGTLAWQRADARVSVSNHFVRFALVPEAAKLRNAEERAAAARHHLRTVYGDRAERWRVACGECGGDGAAIAAGIEPELIEGIAATLAAANLRPIAVEPFLVTAFNLCRRAIRREPAWLAVAEPGRLCLAYFERGAWRRLRADRVRDSLAEELPAALERSRLADGIQRAGRVLLVSRDQARVELPPGSDWSLQAIKPNAPGATRVGH